MYISGTRRIGFDLLTEQARALGVLHQKPARTLVVDGKKEGRYVKNTHVQMGILYQLRSYYINSGP